MLDQPHELFRQVDVRAFESAGAHRTAATAAGRAHRRRTAVPRVDPQVLSGAAEAVVRTELRDRELADGELLTVGVKALHDALAIDRHAREVTRGVAVLRLAGDVGR